MTDYTILNGTDHADLRVVESYGPEYGDNMHCCPAYTFEFRDLQADFPILLQEAGDMGMIPVALMGFEQGENLCIVDGAWRTLNVPAFMRKGPFAIGEHKAEGGESVRLLSIDMDDPRVSKAEGQPLFQPLGGRTDYLDHMANLLEAVYLGSEDTLAFTRELAAHDLVESVTVEITLKDGSKNQLMGFYTLNEGRIRDLSGEQLAAFAAAGHLMPMFMMLASMSNLKRLIDRKEEARAQGA
jgi:hypothetical protein